MGNDYRLDNDADQSIDFDEPKMYKVVLLNDDYTTMEFVVSILVNVFKKTKEQAFSIMMNVHEKGSGICGVYTYEIAEAKVAKVKSLAKASGHPLRITIEEE